MASSTSYAGSRSPADGLRTLKELLLVERGELLLQPLHLRHVVADDVRLVGVAGDTARGGRTSARVAGHHARHALHVLEHGVHSPKASSREHGDLLTLGRRDPGRGGEGRDLRLSDADTGEEGHEATEQGHAGI